MGWMETEAPYLTKYMKQTETIIKPTRLQKEIISKMFADEGSYIIAHKKITGAQVYRLRDSQHNPIKNFRTGVMFAMINKGYIVKGEPPFYKLDKEAVADLLPKRKKSDKLIDIINVDGEPNILASI